MSKNNNEITKIDEVVNDEQTSNKFKIASDESLPRQHCVLSCFDRSGLISAENLKAMIANVEASVKNLSEDEIAVIIRVKTK